jgi:hypothetical protein
MQQNAMPHLLSNIRGLILRKEIDTLDFFIENVFRYDSTSGQPRHPRLSRGRTLGNLKSFSGKQALGMTDVSRSVST